MTGPIIWVDPQKMGVEVNSKVYIYKTKQYIVPQIDVHPMHFSIVYIPER